MAVVVPYLKEKPLPTRLPWKVATLWHLLSLDAPTVAALWSWSFARAAGLSLPILAPLLLATGTWLVYITDRIFDGLGSGNHDHLRERHYFYRRHRRLFLSAGFVTAPVFGWIVFTRMAPNVRAEDAGVFAVAVIYFLLVHARGRRVEQWLPKELAVGVLFAAATAVPAWARAAGERWMLAPLVVLFAALCWLNCVAIENWECDRRLPLGAHPLTRWVARHLTEFCAGIGLSALALTAVSIGNTAMACMYAACALASLLLLTLNQSQKYLSPIQLRISADAALLTPVLFLAWLR